MSTQPDAQAEQPDRQALQSAGTHPAPCARHCEAQAFEIAARGMRRQIAELQAALAEQPAQQEPVAHRDGFWCVELTCMKCYSADFRFKHSNSVVNESLTTQAQTTPQAQPAREPLTDDELADLWYKQSLDWMEFARAIEAAHGITKENT